MKKINYITNFESTLHSGYIVKETNNYLTVASDILYFWNNRQTEFDLFKYAKLDIVDKNESIFFECEFDDFFDDWIFNFPLNDANITDFNEIYNFFINYLSYKKISISKRLEYAVMSCGEISEETLKNLISYIYSFFDYDINCKKADEILNKKNVCINKFIYYIDPKSGDKNYSFLLEEDAESYYLINPFIMEWCNRNNDHNFLKDIKPKKFKKHSISFEFVQSYKTEEWVFDYDISIDDLEYIEGITYFFETFNFYSDFPFIQRLEIAARHNRFNLPKQKISKLIDFISSVFSDQRLKILFSEELLKYKT